MKRVSILFIIINLFISMAFGEGADYPQIKAAVNPQESTIGVPIEYKITISGKSLKGIEIKLPEKKVYNPDENKIESNKGNIKGKENDDSKKIPLYIIHNARRQDQSEKDISYLSIIVDLSYYRPGKYSMPEVEIYGPDRVNIGYKIPDITIKAVNEKAEFQEIEPPLELGGNYNRVILIAAIAVLIAFSVYFLIRYINLKRKKKEAAEVITPPIDIFLQAFKSLTEKNYIEKGDVEGFILEISFIFRRFLSSLYGFDAMEMTASEIMAAMKNSLTPLRFEKSRNDIQSMLNLWDLAKFAEFAPSKDALYSNMDLTLKLAKRLNGDRYART